MQVFSSADRALAAKLEAADAANLLALAQSAQAAVQEIAFSRPPAGWQYLRASVHR